MLFLLRDNRLLYFDRPAFYQHLQKQLFATEKLGAEMEMADYKVLLRAPSSSIHCLEFQPQPNVGELWHRLIQSKGLMPQLFRQHSPSEFYFFFWVDANSFELFREIRQYLWDQHYEVGWKPVSLQSPLFFCSGLYRAVSFQPQ